MHFKPFRRFASAIPLAAAGVFASAAHPALASGATIGLQAQAPAATPGSKPAQQRPPDLRSLANSAVHLLRSAQTDDGAYGGSVETSGLALYGFAKCVRQYREADGPFITKAVAFIEKNIGADGSAGSAQDTDRALSSGAAALALDALDATKYAKTTAALLAFVAKQTSKPVPEAATGMVLERYLADALPSLFPALPADLSDPAELAMQGLDPAARPADALKAARRLITTNALAARAPAPKPEERPPLPLPAFDPNATVDVASVIKKGIEFLAKRQAPDGSFGATITKDQTIGVTAIVANALWLYPGNAPEEILNAARKSTALVAAAARPDGAIHGGGLENYTTSAAVGALAASRNPQYQEIIQKARNYISGLQADEGEGYSSEHWAYGGFGYGNEERPDMSNTNFALDALKAAGAGSTDPAIQKALKFLERCQNRSESNTTEITRDGVTAVPGNDGGGVYYPGKSQAGTDKTSDGRKEVPRSYGSMTYALMKGFIFAGLPKDDPRLKAAADWCAKNYTLDRVPGYEEMARVSPRIAHQGLYYYYMTMAGALSALGTDTITTHDGKTHNWRRDLAARIASMQKPDGSWINENSPRWYEGDELIATAYAVLTLNMLQK